MTDPPIRVLLTDDHAAVRAGLRALLELEPGMEVSGEATDAYDLAPAVYGTRPDVVILDYQLPGGDGISLCRSLKRGVAAPSVVLYSAFVGDAMTVPAHIAGADALVDKAVAPRELMLAVRRVFNGERLLPDVLPEMLAAAEERVEARDVAALRCLTSGSSPADTAGSLGLEPDEVDACVDRVLTRLTVAQRDPGS